MTWMAQRLIGLQWNQDDIENLLVARRVGEG